MQIKLSHDLDERTRFAKAAMSVDEFLARFPEVPCDLCDEATWKSPPERARPSERLPGGAGAHPTNVSRQPPVGRAADSRGAPEAGHQDRAGDGLQVSGPPPSAAVADLAHVPRQPPPEPGLRLLHRAHGDVQGVVRLRGPGTPQETRR